MTSYGSSTDPRSPTYGTATFSTLSNSQNPLSPSRYSYSSSDTPLGSSDSEGATSDRRMRRVNLSPTGSARDSYESYSEENSMEETAEVEAALNDLDHEFDSTEDMLTEWSRGTSSGAPSYTGTTPSYSTGLGTYTREVQRLSTISERTENMPSRPTSYLRAGGRPANPTPEGHRLSANRNSAASPAHFRSVADLTSDRAPAGRRTGDLIAFFEDRATTPSENSFGHSRVPGYRSQSPFFPYSQSTPHLASTTGYGHTTTGYGSSASRPSSPTKSKADSSVSSASSSVSESLSMSSLLAPPTGGGATVNRTGTQLSPSDFASTFSSTFTASRSTTNTSNLTPNVSSLRRSHTSPRSPLTSVRNIVAAWKERTPLGKSAKSPTESTVSPPSRVDGLFSLRRRAERGGNWPRALAAQPNTENMDSGHGRSSPPKSINSSIIPPPFDMTELGAYARDSREPLRIGVLWYLNVHSGPPYRWQRCQALLYPHMLLLSWIAPGGGRGVVTLDLLNCTEVRSVPSPTHSSAREDVGTIAAKAQIEEGDNSLMEILCPFQLLYTDGVERLAAESARERVRWVSAIWEALDRSISLPNRSEAGSPTGSIGTIRTMTSTTTASGSGSASTVFVPPLHTIPSLSDLHTFSDNSSTGSLSRAPSFPTHHTHTADDGAVSNQSYLYPGDRRVIAPSRSSSLRRTSSLTDLDAEFASAVSRARSAKPGLGFALGLVAGTILGDGSPVTVSSGPRLGADVRVTPPPSAKAKSRPLSDVSDDGFFSAGSRTSTNGLRTATSSFYSLTDSLTPSDQQPTTTGIITDETAFELTSGGSNTEIVPSTLSYRRTESNSFLGDSHDGSYAYGSCTTTSRSDSSLSRSSGVRRSRYSRSHMSSEETSDKENTTTGYALSQSRSTLSTWTRSRSTTPTPAPTAALSLLEVPSSSETEDYQTANSPSTASFKSLPTIPSESDYNTAEVCKTETSTEFVTAERCASDVSTEYVTAEKCKTETETEFVTAALCECDRSTQYETASVCRTIPSEASTPRSLTVDRPVERVPTPPPKTPSVVPSIVSPESEVLPELTPEQEPLPQPEFSSTTSDMSHEVQPELPQDDEAMPPSIANTSETSLASTPSPPESLPPTTRTVTESSEIVVSDVPVSESGDDASLPSLASTAESTPSVHPSQWAPETDTSYDSSHLQPTPFSQTAQLQEGRDISFETSFMRPSVSPLTSFESLTPITETISSSASPLAPSMPLPSIPQQAIPQPVSSPSSGPTPLTLSSTESSSLSRTPSSVSDVSSISTGGVQDDAVSLLDPQATSEISTVPSLLSSRASTGSIHYFPNPTMVPLPPSPMPTDSPAASISLSQSTPQFDVPSIHSALETEPTRSHAETITHDIDRILHHIHELDRFRGQETQEISENVRIIRDELYDLSDYVRTRVVSSGGAVGRQRTPVIHRDQSVGGSSIISDRRIAPSGPRSHPGLIPIPLTPPPHFTRSLSVSSGGSGGSYLSSPHSDDMSLLGTPEEFELASSSPSWSSEPSSLSSDLTPSTISSSEPSPGPSLSLTSSSSSPTPPPSSPTPSTASSSTARPVEGITLVSIRDMLTQLREQTTALWDGQVSTNHILDELRQSRPVQQDNTDIHERLQNIEHLVETLVTRRREVEEETTRVDDRARVTRADSISETSDALAELESLRSRWEGISSRRGRIHIHAPAPRPAGPSLDEQLLELLGAPPTQAPVGVQPPPPLIPFTYQPAPRPSRSRSASPILRRETAPPLSEPVWSPETLHTHLLRPRPVRREPIRRSARAQPEHRATYDTTPVIPEPLSGRGRTPGPQPTAGQPEPRPNVPPAHPVLPHSLHEPISPRAATAPATLVDDPNASSSWYRPRRAGHSGVFPPPGVVDGPPPSGAQQAHPAYIPMPPGPTVVQMPLFDTLMTILREHRLAQLATVDQQRELMRYMHGLNQWLERDVHDRQAELRSVTARLDQLRADVLGRLGVGAAPGARMQMPEPQHAQPGPFVVPPVPNGAAAGPVPPPQLIGQFPVGFVPQGAALQTPVVPAVARTPSPFTPVIPQAPPGWIGGMPVPGGYPGPVIPPGIPHDGPSSGEQIYFHRPEQHDETVVLGSSPPPSSDGTPAPRPIVVHPPAQPGGTVIIPPSQTGERESRSSTPTQEAWHPPPASPAIPVPAGAYEVPSVIPVPPSVSHHATPPHTTIVNVGPPMGPQVIPVEPQVPPPGQIQSTVPEPVIVQGSGQGGQYGVPMPGMGPQGPLIIQPPVQPPRTVYGPSRSSSRTSERTHGDHVVMVPGSHGHSPPPVVIQAPPGSQGPQSYDDRAIRRSPSIHAYPEGHPSSVAPPVIVNVPTSGSRRRSRSYSPERSHRSRSYSPGEERHPRRLRRRHHDDEYSPDNGGRRGSRSYSPEYRRHRRHEGPYSHEYSEGDRRRHGRERRPRDDYSSEDGRPHRRRDSYSPEDGRRRRHRGDYSPEDGGRRRRRADYSPEDGRRRRHDDHSPEGGGRRRRRDDYSPEDGGRRRRGGDRSPEDGGRTGRRDDYSPGDGSRRRHRGEYSPEDSGRHRHRPGGRSTYSPEDDDRDLDRPRPILSEGRLHHTRPEFIEGDAGSIPAYSQPLPHPVVPPSPLPPTVIRIGGDQPEHDIPRVIISPSSQRPFSPERRPLSPRSQLGHELRHVRPGDTYIPTAPSEAGGRHPSRPPTSMPDAPEPQHPSAGIVMSSSPERSDFHRTPSRGGFPPDVTERPPSDMVHHIPPPPHVPSHPYPGPGDVDFEATLQAQHERMDNELVRFAENADAAESRRDEEFRQNEDARDRIFVENENRRDAEMRQRSDALFQQLEDRVASVPPLPVPPPHDPERASIIESISAAQDAASRHASDIMDTVRMEREDMAREREALAAEREHDHAELAAERRRLDEEREAKIAALEEELARVRGELESERQLRMTEENEARMAAVERDEALRAQLSDLTNVVQQNHTLCEEKKALMDEHWAEKQRWKEERDRQMAELMGMVSRLVEEQAMVRQREEEQRQANEGKPGIEQVLEELQRQNAEQRELLNELSDSWRTESIRQHEETINAVRATANEQVPYNVQGYLDEFSKALATEVRMLLNEVGKLREERRNIQHELAYLLEMKSKYEPGGEFHPDWKPPMPQGPPPDAPQPPPEVPPPPEDIQPARPAWRSVQPRRARIRKPKPEAPPPEPVVEPRQATSWATWQPNPALAPTPPSVEPTLLVPDRGSPGLFGPRSPRSSYHP